MDRMEEWEVMEFFDVLNYADYAGWEQTRMLLSCHVDKKKIHKLSDIIKFPWDEEHDRKDTEISNEDIQRLKEKASNYLKKINKDNNVSTT